MDRIEQELTVALTKLDEIARKHNYSTGDWTNATKAVFNAIGHKEKCQSYSNYKQTKGCNYISDQIRKHVQQMLGLDVPQYLSEWLYDVMWWTQEVDYALSIPLVCESEWGDIGDVKGDFQKLLLARSKYRVMIFQVGHGMIEWCKKQIHKFEYTQNGDRYLFCSWDESDSRKNNNGFRFELYVVENLEGIRDEIDKIKKEEIKRNRIRRTPYLLECKEYYEKLSHKSLESIWDKTVWKKILNSSMEDDEKELLRQILTRKSKQIDESTLDSENEE